MALNLRAPLVALPAVSSEVRAGLATTAGAVGLLTSVPVLCFGLTSPLASLLIARRGLRGSVLLALGGVVLGTLLRSADGYGTALAGTVVLGAAITVGNIALPVVIGEDFPAAVGLVTALYTAALNIGSTAASALTPVLAQAVGWRVALLGWASLAVVAAAAWWGSGRRPAGVLLRRPDATDAADAADAGVAVRPPTAVWRRASTWGLTVAFAGQGFSYYGATAWLPTLLADEQGMARAEAGASSSIFQLTAVVGAFCVPLLLRATARPRQVLWLVCAAWTALPAGLLAAPSLWWLWCSLAGAAQGGGITVIFVAVVARSADAAEGRRLSAVVQGAGYTVAALGPAVVGAAHDASGGWRWPLGVVAASIAVMVTAGSFVLPSRGPRRAEVVPEGG